MEGVMVLKRKSMPFIRASLLSLPFLAFLVFDLIEWALKAANVHCPSFIDGSLIWGYVFLVDWTFISLPVLALVAVSVFMAWFQEGKTRFEIIFTGIYSVVILLYMGFVIWCLVTKQTFYL